MPNRYLRKKKVQKSSEKSKKAHRKEEKFLDNTLADSFPASDATAKY